VFAVVFDFAFDVQRSAFGVRRPIVIVLVVVDFPFSIRPQSCSSSWSLIVHSIVLVLVRVLVLDH
jgi:hypothetical protein